MISLFAERHALQAMRTAPDALTAARATAVLNAHLRIHLNKEDAHLSPILRERTTESEQASIVGTMARKVPPDRAPTLVRWLFPLLGHDDRAVVTRGWMTLMPPQVFAGLKPLIRETVAEDWAELTRRVPELDQPDCDSTNSSTLQSNSSVLPIELQVRTDLCVCAPAVVVVGIGGGDPWCAHIAHPMAVQITTAARKLTQSLILAGPADSNAR
jgi:hypothetical protein